MLSHTHLGKRLSAQLYDPILTSITNKAGRRIKSHRALIVLQHPESYFSESLSPQFFLCSSAKRASDSLSPMAWVHVYSPNLASRLRRVDVTAPRRRDPPQRLVSLFRDADAFSGFKDLTPTCVTLPNGKCAQIFIRNDPSIGDSPRLNVDRRDAESILQSGWSNDHSANSTAREGQSPCTDREPVPILSRRRTPQFGIRRDHFVAVPASRLRRVLLYFQQRNRSEPDPGFCILTMRKYLACFAAAALFLAFRPSVANAQRQLTIGIVTGQLDGQTAQSFKPFTSYLAGRIPGTQFEIVPLPTIGDLMHAVERKQLDFAFATPAALVELNVRRGARAIATVLQPVAGGQDYPWLAGAVFVRDSRSDIRRLDDVRGKRVIALSPLALGGWLSAVRELRKVGIHEDKDLGTLRFVFSYAKVAQEVCEGNADVGILSAGALMQVESMCGQKLRVLPSMSGGKDPRYPAIISTELYPEEAFAVVGDDRTRGWYRRWRSRYWPSNPIAKSHGLQRWPGSRRP